MDTPTRVRVYFRTTGAGWDTERDLLVAQARTRLLGEGLIGLHADLLIVGQSAEVVTQTVFDAADTAVALYETGSEFVNRPSLAGAGHFLVVLGTSGLPGPARRIDDIDGAAHSAAYAARLRAQFELDSRLARGGKFVGPGGAVLQLGQTRVAVFDSLTGKIHYDVSNAGSHLGVLQRFQLPTTTARYAGGFIEATEDGQLVFRPISGTFPYTEADLPGNILDLIRGTGVSVPERF